MSDNIYYYGAKPCVKEKNFIESSGFNPEVKLKEEGDNVYLNLTLNQEYYTNKGQIITSEILGSAKIPKTRFENANGTALIFDKDFFGNIRSSENSVAGPFVGLAKGNLTLKLW